MPMRSILLVTAALVAASAPSVAQTGPGPGAPPRPAMMGVARDPALPLTMAYYTIGHAEQAGATGHYIDAARTHYRGALDRYGRNDAVGAAAEAMLSADLARAAIDERPQSAMPVPKDVPAPPSPRPRPSGEPPMGDVGHERTGPMMGRGFGHGFGGHRMGGRGFDATHLAEALKVETGAEARALAQAAVDADAAAKRAALAGNVAEAGRSSRVASDLMAAVDDLVRLNHPADERT